MGYMGLQTDSGGSWLFTGWGKPVVEEVGRLRLFEELCRMHPCLNLFISISFISYSHLWSCNVYALHTHCDAAHILGRNCGTGKREQWSPGVSRMCSDSIVWAWMP